MINEGELKKAMEEVEKIIKFLKENEEIKEELFEYSRRVQNLYPRLNRLLFELEKLPETLSKKEEELNNLLEELDRITKELNKYLERDDYRAISMRIHDSISLYKAAKSFPQEVKKYLDSLNSEIKEVKDEVIELQDYVPEFLGNEIKNKLKCIEKMLNEYEKTLTDYQHRFLRKIS